MKRKLIFFDIDGTLLDYEKKIPDSTKEAINILKAKGHKVAIATGRAPFMFEWVREALGIETYVSYNGQYVVYENQVIFQNPLDHAFLDQITQKSIQAMHPMAFMGEDSVVTSVQHHDYLTEGFNSLKMEVPHCEPDFYKSKHVYQSLLFCNEDEIKDYKEFNGHFDFIRWHPVAVDIIPKGGSKANGIKKLTANQEISGLETVAFGDALNDIEMLSFVDHGVAMGNAMQETKQAADWVTKDVSEDGIFHGLKQMGLI